MLHIEVFKHDLKNLDTGLINLAHQYKDYVKYIESRMANKALYEAAKEALWQRFVGLKSLSYDTSLPFNIHAGMNSRASMLLMCQNLHIDIYHAYHNDVDGLLTYVKGEFSRTLASYRNIKKVEVELNVVLLMEERDLVALAEESLKAAEQATGRSIVKVVKETEELGGCPF